MVLQLCCHVLAMILPCLVVLLSCYCNALAILLQWSCNIQMLLLFVSWWGGRCRCGAKQAGDAICHDFADADGGVNGKDNADDADDKHDSDVDAKHNDDSVKDKPNHGDGCLDFDGNDDCAYDQHEVIIRCFNPQQQ